jgi:hypothetical protein
MPSANVEENINKIEHAIEELTQEVFRLQGSLRVCSRASKKLV